MRGSKFPSNWGQLVPLKGKRRTPHAGILADVKDLLALNRGMLWLTHQGGGIIRRSGRAPLMGTPGVPDAIALCQGVPFFFEAKAGRDKLRPAQVDFRTRFEYVHWPVVVGGVDDVIAFLASRGIVIKII